MEQKKRTLNDTQRYTLFGVLFGLLFPAIATVIRLVGSNTPFSGSSAFALHMSDPLLWIIDLAPIFLGIFAAFAGKRQDQLRILNVELRQRESELIDERNNLEKHVEERTARLAKKSDQLRSASYIARQTAEVQELEGILNTATSLITDQYGFYHTGIFLMNDTGDEVILQAASSEGGKRMIEKGYSFAVGSQGIVGYVAAQKQSRIALDVGPDAVFFNNPDLPLTRSQVVVPLLIRNKVVGILDIQSDKPQAFLPDDIDVLETLADLVAIAIENARLLDETQAALLQLEAVTAVRTREAWAQKLTEKGLVFTYTPLGLRAGKVDQNKGESTAVPIHLRGQKIGAITIARKGQATWSRVDQDLLTEVATQVGLAIDNLRLLEEATQRAKQEQTVGELAARFSQSIDVDSLLQTAARELGQLPDVSEVSVFISQSDSDTKVHPRMRRRAG